MKYILDQIRENTSALTFYVNCWENRTLNLVLDRLVEQAGLVLSEISYSVKAKRLKSKIKHRQSIIALDEVDKLDKKTLNDILYLLKDFGKTGIVCISNTRKYVLTLDPRVMSRFSFISINFPAYSDEELLMILKHRAEDCKALYPRSYTKSILEKIADIAAGDARVAIQTLKSSAYSAELGNNSKIREEDVMKGYESVKELRKKYDLERLSQHHKLLIDIIKRKPNICSSEIFRVYHQEARKNGMNPKSSRTCNNYLSDLINLSFIKTERARVKGNIRIFSHLMR